MTPEAEEVLLVIVPDVNGVTLQSIICVHIQLHLLTMPPALPFVIIPPLEKVSVSVAARGLWQSFKVTTIL